MGPNLHRVLKIHAPKLRIYNVSNENLKIQNDKTVTPIFPERLYQRGNKTYAKTNREHIINTPIISPFSQKKS